MQHDASTKKKPVCDAFARRAPNKNDVDNNNDNAESEDEDENKKEEVAHGHQLAKLGQNWMLDNLIKDKVYTRQTFAELDCNLLMFSNKPYSICQFMATKLEI